MVSLVYGKNDMVESHGIEKLLTLGHSGNRERKEEPQMNIHPPNVCLEEHTSSNQAMVPDSTFRYELVNGV